MQVHIWWISCWPLQISRSDAFSCQQSSTSIETFLHRRVVLTLENILQFFPNIVCFFNNTTSPIEITACVTIYAIASPLRYTVSTSTVQYVRMEVSMCFHVHEKISLESVHRRDEIAEISEQEAQSNKRVHRGFTYLAAVTRSPEWWVLLAPSIVPRNPARVLWWSWSTLFVE